MDHYHRICNSPCRWLWFPIVVFSPSFIPPGLRFLFFLVSMVKAIVPRYRYDQLMRLGWKVFLPLSLAAVVVVATALRIWDHGL